MVLQLPTGELWFLLGKITHVATKLDKEEEGRQEEIRLTVIGKEGNKIFRSFTWASPADAKKFLLYDINLKSILILSRSHLISFSAIVW